MDIWLNLDHFKQNLFHKNTNKLSIHYFDFSDDGIRGFQTSDSVNSDRSVRRLRCNNGLAWMVRDKR